MKKGFTLIELIAVMAILAAIALIGTPITLNIVENSRKNSVIESAQLYEKAVELAIANQNLSEKYNPSSCDVLTKDTVVDGYSIGDLVCGDKYLEVDREGYKIKSGRLKLLDGSVIDGSTLEMTYSVTRRDGTWIIK